MAEGEGIGIPKEVAQGQRPEFNGGIVTISHFSDSPEGFDFATRESVRRKTGGRLAKLALTDEQKGRLKKGMQPEMQFQGVGDLRQAKQSWRDAQGVLHDAQTSDADAQRIEQLTTQATESQHAFETQREKYVKGMAGKIGIRNIEIDGNTLLADVKLVSFPVYTELANSENSPQIVDLSSILGIAMILRSADGRLIVQHRAIEKQRLHEEKRTRGNATYTDIPGASVGESMDASLNSPDRKAGEPDAVDTTAIKNLIIKGTGEELGLSEHDLKRVRILGIAHDKIKIHDSMLLFGESDLTAAQIYDTSRSSKKNKNLGDADFEEKFVDIEASPEAIEKLLTQVQCPVPADHVGAFVAAGREMMIEEQGLDAAIAWTARLEKGIEGNYRRMNEMVKAFYDKHPEALTYIPERFWGKNVPLRNLHAYTPTYSPEEQGLPNFEDEMTRTGLVPETRRETHEAYFFDVDGVLTDPVTKEVADPQLLSGIIDKLKQGRPTALNTERSTVWLQEEILNPLIQMTDDKSIFENLVVIGEKGGTWVTFDDEGKAHHGKTKAVPLPTELHDRVRELVAERYADAMFFDDTKQTMISVEMRDGFDLAEFTRQQQAFKEDLARVLSETNRGDQFRIDPTTIGTDIENPYVGKDVVSDRFLQFLKDRNIKPRLFRVYGDSRSDFAISDEFYRRNRPVEFVYVGDRQNLEEAGIIQKDYRVVYVGGFTQDILNSLQASN